MSGQSLIYTSSSKPGDSNSKKLPAGAVLLFRGGGKGSLETMMMK